MLKLKKISSRKIASYSIVLIILFGGTAFVLYKNFFTGEEVILSPAAVSNTAVDSSGIGGSNLLPDIGKLNIEEELSFISSAKFRKLQDNFSEIKTEELGNKNPFAASGQPGANEAAGQRTSVLQPAEEAAGE